VRSANQGGGSAAGRRQGQVETCVLRNRSLAGAVPSLGPTASPEPADSALGTPRSLRETTARPKRCTLFFVSLIGSLEEVKIGDVLRLFADGHKTGVLTVSAAGGQAVLRFQKGTIVTALAGRLSGDDAVLDIFGWREGQLSFVPEDAPPSTPPNVTRDVKALIEEGVRVGETFHRLHRLIPSDRVVFQLALGPSDDARVSIGSQEWRVIRLLDGARDLREVAEGSGVPKPEVSRILFELTEAGFLQRVEMQKVLRAHALTGLFSREGAELDERLREEWTKVPRFEGGVSRVQVRTLVGRSTVLPVAFRSGLGRDIHLPKAAIGELGLREGRTSTCDRPPEGCRGDDGPPPARRGFRVVLRLRYCMMVLHSKPRRGDAKVPHVSAWVPPQGLGWADDGAAGGGWGHCDHVVWGRGLEGGRLPPPPCGERVGWVWGAGASARPFSRGPAPSNSCPGCLGDGYPTGPDRRAFHRPGD